MIKHKSDCLYLYEVAELLSGQVSHYSLFSSPFLNHLIPVKLHLQDINNNSIHLKLWKYLDIKKVFFPERSARYIFQNAPLSLLALRAQINGRREAVTNCTASSAPTLYISNTDNLVVHKM